MKLKKSYSFDNKRQIWRIIPTDTGKLIIEERELEKKQAYFHCLYLESGKKIFSNLQLDDKFWVGIEAIKDDIIFFHKFAKPDMPKHRGIFAFDISAKKIIWKNPDLIYQFHLEEKLYASMEKFEGRKYFCVNPSGGEIIEELGNSFELINRLRYESLAEEDNKGYLFPEAFETDSGVETNVNEFIKLLKSNFVISGKVEYILKSQLLMISFHEVNSRGSLNNIFKAVDLSTGKYILEEIINKETNLYLTDSFFVKEDFLFLLYGKTRFDVYQIIN